jgi:hypothetical protein
MDRGAEEVDMEEEEAEEEVEALPASQALL